MTNKSFISYPTSESALDASLAELDFLRTDISIDLSILDFSITQEVPDFLWADIRFFSICQLLNCNSSGHWMVHVTEPNHKYYKNLYGVIPVVFSSEISSSDEYYNIISKQIGNSAADAIIYVWESCIVLPNSKEWAFSFDRESEKGRFYCNNSTHIPDELMLFIE